MTELPLISVIVPAYNSERWLEECFNSFYRQTYQNTELIMIDDGSDDSTLSLARRLAEGKNNVHVIHTENGGVCRARNIGLESAQGEYISFLDSDDMLTDNALEVLFQNLVEKDADIAVGWKSNMTADGRDLGSAYKRMSGFFEGTEGLRLSLEDHTAMHAVWGKLYKRTAIGDTRFIEGKRVHEDSFFVFECMVKQPRVIVCDDIVIRYRLSENSVSRGVFSDKYLDIIYFANRKKDIIEKDYPELIPLSENAVVKASMVVLWNLLNTNDPEYKCIEKQAIQDVMDRKKFFKPALSSDAKLFWIITHGFYGFYKALHTVKRRL